MAIRGSNRSLVGPHFERTHGFRLTPVGNSWSAMMTRCYNKNSGRNYRDYGARGIMVCEKLKASPASLIEVIGDRPIGQTLDRKNGLGSYTCGTCQECIANSWPLNIRWADRKTQSLNRCTTTIVEINGVSKSVTEWAEELGIHRHTIYNRVRKGITGSAILAPAKLIVHRITHIGQTRTVEEWSKLTGVKHATLLARIQVGDTGDALFRPKGGRGKDKKPRKK